MKTITWLILLLPSLLAGCENYDEARYHPRHDALYKEGYRGFDYYGYAGRSSPNRAYSETEYARPYYRTYRQPGYY